MAAMGVMLAPNADVVTLIQSDGLGSRSTYFGRQLTSNAQSTYLAWHKADGSVGRLWEFRNAVGSPARMTQYGDSLVVLVGGRDVTVDGQHLAPDSGDYMHLLVFKNPN